MKVINIYEGLGEYDKYVLQKFVSEGEFITEESVYAGLVAGASVETAGDQAAFLEAYNQELVGVCKEYGVPEELMLQIGVALNYAATDYDMAKEVQQTLEKNYPKAWESLGF